VGEGTGGGFSRDSDGTGWCPLESAKTQFGRIRVLGQQPIFYVDFDSSRLLEQDPNDRPDLREFPQQAWRPGEQNRWEITANFETFENNVVVLDTETFEIAALIGIVLCHNDESE
jgi:hypothetical protein